MRRSVSLILCALFLQSCNNEQAPPKTYVDENAQELKLDVASLLAQEDDIVKRAPQSANNSFAFDLYHQLKSGDNVTYSPFSISLALAMAYAGAKGETEASMKRVLHFGDNTLDFHQSFGQFANLLSNKDRTNNEAIFSISNAQWLQENYRILKDYKDTLAQAYVAKPILLDFMNKPSEATATINQAVSDQTHGEIAKLLKSDLKNDTRLVLTNAIYFRAKWQSQFENHATHQGQFTRKNGEVLDVNYMAQTHRFSYSEDAGKQVLLVPYRDDDFAAVFILPREGKLAEVEQKLSADDFVATINGLESTKVNLLLPKFSQRFAPMLKEVLTKLGLGIIFDEQAVDLSKINGITHGLEKIFISNVVHEAVVKMYEAGTTAAAATAVIAVGATAMPAPEEPVLFHATRPFLFFIIHRASKTILFMGRVDSPQFSDG